MIEASTTESGTESGKPEASSDGKSLTHEMRNALGGVVVWVELLATTTLDERQRKYLEGAWKNIGRMRDLLTREE